MNDNDKGVTMPNERQISEVRERFLQQLIWDGGAGASPSALYAVGVADALGWILSLGEEPRLSPDAKEVNA